MSEQPQPAAARALDVGELAPEAGVRMTFDPARCNHAVSCVVNYEVVTRTVHAIDCPHCLRHKIQQQADEIDRQAAAIKNLDEMFDEKDKHADRLVNRIVELEGECERRAAEIERLRSRVGELDEAETAAKFLSKHLQVDVQAKAAFDKFWKDQCDNARPMDEIRAELEQRDEAACRSSWLRTATMDELRTELARRDKKRASGTAAGPRS